MHTVATLIVNPAMPSLDDSTIAVAVAALKDLGAGVDRPDWLAQGIACDIAFDGLDADQADAALQNALSNLPVDAVVQPSEGRRKALLVADMDSTIVQEETLDELADALGLKDRIAAVTQRAMNGEIDFAQAVRDRVALLAGLSGEALNATIDRITVTPGAKTLVTTMRAHGAYCALVSGGFEHFTSHVRQWIGFDMDSANRLLMANGALTGTVEEPIRDKHDKLKILTTLAADRGLPLSATVTVGDGANDLMMIQAAGLGVAFHAKPVVAQAARARVNHGDLTALLYAQGYRASDFKTG